MQDRQDVLWAKKAYIDGSYYWLPLLVHLEDTMNTAGWLWNHWMTEGQRQNLVNQMNIQDENLAESTIRFLGAVHDIGKATPVFQIEKGFSSSEDLNQQLLDRLERAGYKGISNLVLASSRDTKHALAGEVILSGFGVKDDLTSIVGAHHGKPIDDVSQCEEQEGYPANYYQTEDEFSEIYCKWKETQQKIFYWAMEECGFSEVDDLPEFSRPAQVLLSGLLIMADWIASNTEIFPLLPLEQLYVTDKKRRFADGMQRWNKVLPLEIEEPKDGVVLFRNRFGFSPRGFQKVIFDTVHMIHDPGIVIIEAPTGGGKTEAALAAAEQLAAKTNRSGLFFGLPTQATSNGIFPRILRWLESVTSEYGNVSIRLVHGKAALNKDMQKLSACSHTDIDEGSDAGVLVNEWFSGRKKTALDDFIVGTVDNFLLTALKQKHLALRHLGFDRKVVIIDEVHAYDAYMEEYLSKAIRWMGAYGVPVILLSATLPADRRIALTEAYLLGRGSKKKEIDLSEIDAHSTDYPLITYTDGRKVKQNSDFPKQENKVVRVVRLEEDVLYDKIEELTRDGGIVGIIVNTVSRAQHIAQCCGKLFGGEEIELLHSHFIDSDRLRKEECLIRMIGKGAKRPERKIIIGTQVIEQSLDIDFDVLITDLCPIDLLIQRIGRLHRHEIRRPKKHKEPVSYILGMDEKLNFDSGAVNVYGRYLLARTQAYLPSAIRIPQDVSGLVQKVYQTDGTEEPEFSEEEQKLYEDSRRMDENKKQQKRASADVFRIDSPNNRIKPEKYNLIGWLQTPDSSQTEEKASAQVRDIDDSVEVIAVRRYGSDYGLFQPEDEGDKQISEHVEDYSTGKKLAAQTLRLASSLCRKVGGIDRLIDMLEKYNLEHLRRWQSNPWLKGTLGIIFDEEQNFQINDFVLHYDSRYGLTVGAGRKDNGEI